MKLRIIVPMASIALVVISCGRSSGKFKQNSISAETENIRFEQDRTMDFLPQNVSKFTVTAKKGAQISTADGAKILVAPGTFVDASGKAIEGDVELSYKSINSIAEIVASGVPMSAVNNDKVEQFISDGMFEITASYNNENVTIAEGKEIKVFTPSRDKVSDFKYWFFNVEKGNWEEIGDRDQLSDDAAIKNSISKMGIEPNVGITSYNWLWHTQGKGIFSFTSKIPEAISPNKTIPGAYDKNKSVLDISFDKQKYPELQAYSKILWQFAGNDESQDPDKNEWIYDNIWSDVTLNAVAGSKNLFRLDFIVNQKSFSTVVRPVVSGKDLKEAEAQMAVELERMKEEEARIAAQGADVNTIETNMYNAFTVRRMGTFNCDRFYSDPQAMAITAEFILDDKALEADKTIYFLTDRKQNVIPYSARYYTLNLNPRLIDAIFIVAANGTLAAVGVDQIQSMQNKPGSKIRLVFEKVKTKISNLQNLDEAIGAL